MNVVMMQDTHISSGLNEDVKYRVLKVGEIYNFGIGSQNRATVQKFDMEATVGIQF